MSFLTGSSESSWRPVMTGKTDIPSYWLNWRVILCAIWIVISMTFAIFLIWKHEGSKCARHDQSETEKERAGTLYEDEVWRPCLKGIHPAWLLAFRAVAFFVLLVLLVIIGFVDGPTIFYYYTQWTFTSITIYFGLGTLLSVNGCYQHQKQSRGDRVGNVELDSEKGFSGTPMEISTDSNNVNKPGPESFHGRQSATMWGSGPEISPHRQPASTWGYIFQIIFQMNAGAVMLTDIVFWFVIVPFLAIKDYQLSLLEISMHTINAVFLLGDTALNCLRFPWFRISYFILWTVTYVIFQWFLHACVSMWWPYPFLDLSSPFAPLWYWLVAALHIPCYGLFVLIMKMKHNLLSRWFPHSYQCAS